MHVIDIFAPFYIQETIVLANITKIKRSRIKDDLQYSANTSKWRGINVKIMAKIAELFEPLLISISAITKLFEQLLNSTSAIA